MVQPVRHLVVLFLAVTLSIAGAAHAVQATDMTIKMSAEASAGDMAMPDGCGGCSDDEGMPMACFAMCASNMNAILPSAPSVTPCVLIAQTAPFVSVAVDHHGPPDPYPPRLIILS